MSFDRCIFLARSDSRHERVLLSRAERILGWFAPIAPTARLSTAWNEHLGVIIGIVDFNGDSHDFDKTLFWGAPEPGLEAAEALALAETSRLRDVRGVHSAAAVTPTRARLVTGSAGITTLYESSGRDTYAWSSHAVAAALLARETAELDLELLPEFLALEFIVERGTLVKGVSAVPAARAVTIEGTTHVDASWTDAQRWALVPEDEAREFAERCFVDHVGAAVGDRACALGLTAGADSQAAAAALREVGAPTATFTWGDPEWPDTQGAARAASVLDLPHETKPIAPYEAGAAEAAFTSAVRWTEGTLPPGIAPVPWPVAAAVVTGAGGEVGRAFYYRYSAASHPRATGAALVAATPFARHLHHARQADRDRVLSGVRRRLADLHELGLDGYRPLDAFYADERMAHWGRARIPPIRGAFIPAFVWPDVSRALASLSFAERMRDGFHRAFLAKRAPALIPPVPPVQRGGVPSWARRAMADARARRDRVRPSRSPLGQIVTSNRGVHAWLSGVLERPELVDALGSRWAGELQRGFAAEDGVATQQALLAAAALTFADALNSEPSFDVAAR